jgi:hypothetical protein
LVPVLTLALQEVHDRLGVPWTRPGVNARLIIVLVSLLITAIRMADIVSRWG